VYWHGRVIAVALATFGVVVATCIRDIPHHPAFKGSPTGTGLLPRDRFLLNGYWNLAFRDGKAYC
jgi:hypothetical protein